MPRRRDQHNKDGPMVKSCAERSQVFDPDARNDGITPHHRAVKALCNGLLPPISDTRQDVALPSSPARLAAPERPKPSSHVRNMNPLARSVLGSRDARGPDGRGIFFPNMHVDAANRTDWLVL